MFWAGLRALALLLPVVVLASAASNKDELGWLNNQRESCVRWEGLGADPAKSGGSSPSVLYSSSSVVWDMRMLPHLHRLRNSSITTNATTKTRTIVESVTASLSVGDDVAWLSLPHSYILRKQALALLELPRLPKGRVCGR